MPNEHTFHTSCAIRPRMTLCRVILLVLAVQTNTVHAQLDNTALLRAVAIANARKTQVEQYIREIKTLANPSEPVYAESRRRYFLAYSLNNDFMADAMNSFAGGKRGIGLAAKASEVELRTSEFTEYACGVVFGKRRSIGELAHSAMTLIDVASDQKHAVHIDRQIASALLMELQWRSWADVN